MELSHLIWSSQVENVRVCCPLMPPVTGTLCVSSHHLILSASPVEGTKQEKCELWLLHCAVDSVEKSVQNIGMLKSKDSSKDGDGRSSSGTVTLKCKDLRVIQLEIPDMEETFNVARSVQALSSLENISLRYPFFYRPAGCKLGKGWPRHTMENFYHNLKAETDAWRLSDVNNNFKVCPSYPEKVIVPVSCSDTTLKRAAAFRQGRRFPVLSYYHPRNKMVLLRSSQPLVGPNHHCCEDDEMLLDAALMGQWRGFIIDTRTEQEAKQARSAGGGTENKNRGQALQSSLTRVVGACYETYLGRNHWLSKLQASQWLSHIKEALSTAGLAAECIEREGTCVLVHGEEGTNNTLLVTSLAQLILSPDCRTVVGFQDLIEREWLQAGHPFQVRCARSGWAHGRFQQESPNFLLFLDCCWQLTRQFPMAMEFNEKFLCTLATHAYSSEYGTFLCNSEKERYVYKIRENTHSLWGALNNFQQRKYLVNPVYERNALAIWPSVAPQSIELWEGFFLRYFVPTKHKEMSWQRTWELSGSYHRPGYK
ncbi:myotubularin-related protein 9-like isoform X3 [Hyla sarda]|uniref:myotubularin-related protein 9-like isoform X3 n=1 Tax=Hyla sarda TaxID=327740 RepID=UPI0024C4289D|nr:myotubularin-related protein 9-like isoform X3 [Hyla sarda]